MSTNLNMVTTPVLTQVNIPVHLKDARQMMNGTHELSNGHVHNPGPRDPIPSEVPKVMPQPSIPARPVEPSATEIYLEKSTVAYELSKLPLKAARPLKVIVAGAGISALSLAHNVAVGKIENIDLRILEKNAGLGGTWYENRYPGCACDVPSHNYLVSYGILPIRRPN